MYSNYTKHHVIAYELECMDRMVLLDINKDHILV